MQTKELVDQLMRQLKERDKLENDLKEICLLVVDASLYWTGEDEAKNPALKRVRTCAGYRLEEQLANN